MIIGVLVELSNKNIDKIFDYSVPDNLKDKIKVGIRVKVPFGKMELEGFVIEIKNSSDISVKDILEVVDDEVILNEELLELGKKIQEDTLLKERTAKRKIAHMINTDDTNLKQKLEIMLDHFTSKIQYMLDGQAKAMVVTSSREAAVKYKNIFDELIKEKHRRFRKIKCCF